MGFFALSSALLLLLVPPLVVLYFLKLKRPRLNVPSLVLWGQQDAIVPLNCGELYQRAIPGSNLVVIDECGHSPHIEKPNDFLDAVVPFVTAA